MQYTELFEAGIETKAGQPTLRGDAGEVARDAVQREIRLPVGVMNQPLCDAPQKKRRKCNRGALEIVQSVRAAQGRSAGQMAAAAQALEILKAGRDARVSQVRTGLALGAYESEAKIDFLVERILEEVDREKLAPAGQEMHAA